MKTTPTTGGEPTTAGGAVLPVVGYRLNSGHGNRLRETIDDATKAFLWAGKPAWRELTYLDTAQAEIDALRAELQAMTDDRDSWCQQASARTEDAVRFAAERDALRAENEQWKSTLWAVARELNCLPSTFSDGNAHVLKAAIKLSAELAALKAAQDDQARDAGRLALLAKHFADADESVDYCGKQSSTKETP